MTIKSLNNKVEQLQTIKKIYRKAHDYVGCDSTTKEIAKLIDDFINECWNVELILTEEDKTTILELLHERATIAQTFKEPNVVQTVAKLTKQLHQGGR